MVRARNKHNGQSYSTMPEVVRSASTVKAIDLWCFNYPSAMDCATTVKDYEGLLERAELVRYRSFVFDKDRLMFLATRALVRTVLSHYASLPPTAWRFESNVHGKPRLASMPTCGPLHFNLSNTHGLVICGVSRFTERLGVDVESLLRDISLAEIVEDHFAASEAAAWRAQPEGGKHEAFFRFWTLKECFIKATGQGLSMPLDQFSFSLTQGHPTFTSDIAISFGSWVSERSENWRFAQWCIAGKYMIALGADTDGKPMRCRLRRGAPLMPGHGEFIGCSMCLRPINQGRNACGLLD
jgi:4'-phosphopantetheinyl transferase